MGKGEKEMWFLKRKTVRGEGGGGRQGGLFVFTICQERETNRDGNKKKSNQIITMNTTPHNFRFVFPRCSDIVHASDKTLKSVFNQYSVSVYTT